MTLARLLTILTLVLLPLLVSLNSCESEPEVIDTTRPTAVTDFSLDSTRGNALFFSWTATGDDGNLGRASYYDVRYAYDSTTLQLWGDATDIQGEPHPSDPGTHEQVMLNLMPDDSTYYFGIKVSDDSRNTSRLSNIVTFHP